jgi:hypothetical protein
MPLQNFKSHKHDHAYMDMSSICGTCGKKLL